MKCLRQEWQTFVFIPVKCRFSVACTAFVLKMLHEGKYSSKQIRLHGL